MQNIDRGSKIPLYQQLYVILRESIDQGEWQPGDLIPPEPELMARYQVSRITVRQTLDMLVNEGLIYRQQGRGTFVAHPTVEQTLLRIVSFTDDMRQRRFEPGTKVLSTGLVAATKEIAKKLAIEPGEELARIKRLRLADGEPMSVEESFLIHHWCPGVLKHDYASNPLREVLEQRYDVYWSHASQTIRAISNTGDLTELLSMPAGEALLYIERVSYSQQDIPIEFLRIYYRGDRYVLYNELSA